MPADILLYGLGTKCRTVTDNNGTSKLLLVFLVLLFSFFFLNTLTFAKFHNKAKKAGSNQSLLELLHPVHNLDHHQ